MSIGKSILEKSDYIQSNRSRRDRKDKGVFYTPPEVVERMTGKVLDEVDLVENPYIRVLDPACGTGLFLIQAFQVLKEKFEMDYEEVLEKNDELAGRIKRDDIGSFIVENCLWGMDVDAEALETAGEILRKLAGKACRLNLLKCDSLLYETEEEFDYILGNPPYIGHKQVTKEYKKELQTVYKGIYRDKSDISYCFLKKGIDLLKKGGSLSFITSRYFMEGPSATGLRRYITELCSIDEIVDFYGGSIFQDAAVAACIITLRKGLNKERVPVLKLKDTFPVPKADLFRLSNFEQFTVKMQELKDEGWVLLNSDKHAIYSALETKSSFKLGDIAESYQGIITGCDKAFVVNRTQIEKHGIEGDLLKPWIKNSNVQKHNIETPGQYLIYSNFIEEEKKFPNAIKYISQYRERLMERRECRRGVRKWYQLQWGRTNEIFDTPKIVYPFKSSGSRFAVDTYGYYCSADIYSLKLREEYKNRMTLDYIAAILNSKLFEFYFKCYAKKISGKLYDFYPNTVLRMKVPIPEQGNRIEVLAFKLKNCKDDELKKAVVVEIDREIYKLYALSEIQIKIVEEL